jgi:hypothetical protein
MQILFSSGISSSLLARSQWPPLQSALAGVSFQPYGTGSSAGHLAPVRFGRVRFVPLQFKINSWRVCAYLGCSP